MTILRQVKQVEAVVLRALSQDRRLPATAFRMVELHLQSPWIHGFGAVVLHPLRGGLQKFLAGPACTTAGTIWSVPSVVFWKAHARASHPPDGSGCDPEVHISFLTEEGRFAEFIYAYLLEDGRVRTASPEDFERECRWWKENF